MSADEKLGQRFTSMPLQRIRWQTVKFYVKTVVWYTLLGAGAWFMIMPLVWMVSTSLKLPSAIFDVPIKWIPHPMVFRNYPEALGSAPFARYFFNSVFVGFCVTVLNLFFDSLAGYGFAKYEFPGRDIMFLMILSTMMVPFQVVMMPLFIIVKSFGWLNTYLGLIIPGSISAFGIFLMRQFILTLPNEIFDSARIDGASEFRTYYQIVLPLCKPALAVLAISTFMWEWNSLLWPLIVINKQSLRPLALGLSEFRTVYGTSYHYLMAASTVAVAPIILVFAMLQKQFIQGISISGIKG